MEAKDENGKYVYDEDIDGLKNNEARLKFNILEERKNTDYWLKNFAIKPMLSLNYKPVTWLNLSTQVFCKSRNPVRKNLQIKKHTLFANIGNLQPMGTISIFCRMEV